MGQSTETTTRRCHFAELASLGRKTCAVLAKSNGGTMGQSEYRSRAGTFTEGIALAVPVLTADEHCEEVRFEASRWLPLFSVHRNTVLLPRKLSVSQPPYCMVTFGKKHVSFLVVIDNEKGHFGHSIRIVSVCIILSRKRLIFDHAALEK